MLSPPNGRKIKCSERLTSLSFKLELLLNKQFPSSQPMTLTYKWVLQLELISFVNQLVWAHFIGYCSDVLIDVLVGAQPGLEHFVLLAMRITSNRLFQTAFATLQHFSDSLFFQLLFHFLMFYLNGPGPSIRFSLCLGYRKLSLFYRVTVEKLIALGLVDLRKGVFGSVLVHVAHLDLY